MAGVDLSTRMERKSIEELIRQDPTTVTLIRHPRVRSDTGGYVEGPPVTLRPQVFHLQSFKRRLTDETVRTEQGTVQSLLYTLVGKWNADIQQNDTFFLGDDEFEVEAVDLDRRVRTAAQVHLRSEGTTL
jgi:hypothetical protein